MNGLSESRRLVELEEVVYVGVRAVWRQRGRDNPTVWFVKAE